MTGLNEAPTGLEGTPAAKTLMRAKGLERIFRGRNGGPDIRAIAGVDLTILKGETLGLVGESGSGKSTLGRMLAGLDAPTRGTVMFDHDPVLTKDSADFRNQRSDIQFVFQDPMSALNPRLTVERQVAEALRAHQEISWPEATDRARAFLQRVGVNRDLSDRFVHQLSGGQRQRVVIARSLVLDPQFVVFDEPVSALDLSIQAQILDLIAEMQGTLNLTSVFITHDLRVVRYVSDRIAVLYLGLIVEQGDADEVYHRPRHPYTQALLSSISHIDPAKRQNDYTVIGEITSSDASAAGCVFAPRCPLQTERCLREAPKLEPVSDMVEVACHLVEIGQ